jgi:hypothetical protein
MKQKLGVETYKLSNDTGTKKLLYQYSINWEGPKEERTGLWKKQRVLIRIRKIAYR